MEGATDKKIWHNGSLRGQDDARTSNTRAEKARDTTLDDEKYDVRCRERHPIGKHMTDGT